MMVTNVNECASSVIMGASEPIVEYRPMDVGYAKELMRRATQFMQSVDNMTPPVLLAPVAPPVIADKIVMMDWIRKWSAQAAR